MASFCDCIRFRWMCGLLANNSNWAADGRIERCSNKQVTIFIQFSSNRRIKPERFMHWNQEVWCEATIAVLFMIFPRHHSSAMLWRTKALWWLWKGGPKFHLSGSSEVGCISCQVLVRLSKWPLIPASVRPIASPTCFDRDFFDLFLMSKYFNTEFYLLTFQVQDCFQFDAIPSSQDAGSPGKFAVIVLTCWHRQG